MEIEEFFTFGIYGKILGKMASWGHPFGTTIWQGGQGRCDGTGPV